MNRLKYRRGLNRIFNCSRRFASFAVSTRLESRATISHTKSTCSCRASRTHHCALLACSCLARYWAGKAGNRYSETVLRVSQADGVACLWFVWCDRTEQSFELHVHLTSCCAPKNKDILQQLNNDTCFAGLCPDPTKVATFNLYTEESVL